MKLRMALMALAAAGLLAGCGDAMTGTWCTPDGDKIEFKDGKLFAKGKETGTYRVDKNLVFTTDKGAGVEQAYEKTGNSITSAITHLERCSK